MKTMLKDEIDRMLKICVDGHIQEYRGDSRNENKVWDLLDELDCHCILASNYDFRSTWNGVEQVLWYLKILADKEKNEKEKD